MVITNSVDYVRWTQTTALYMDKCDTDDRKQQYEALGILDEVGELAGMLKREIRDGVKLDREKFNLELGDLAWYLARMHYDHADLPLDSDNELHPLVSELNLLEEVKGLTCFDIAIFLSEKMKEHFISKDAAATFMFGGRPTNLIEMIKQAHNGFTRNDAASSFVTKMYQRVCDIENVPTVGILMHLISEATTTNAVLDWCTLCYRYNFDILDVLQNNVIKLESRKERGTLHGKGSER